MSAGPRPRTLSPAPYPQFWLCERRSPLGPQRCEAPPAATVAQRLTPLGFTTPLTPCKCQNVTVIYFIPSWDKMTSHRVDATFCLSVHQVQAHDLARLRSCGVSSAWEVRGRVSVGLPHVPAPPGSARHQPASSERSPAWLLSLCLLRASPQ